MGGEKMEVAGTNIMCILTMTTSSRWADNPSKEVPKGTLNKMLKDAGIKKQWKDMVQHHPFKLPGVVFKWRFVTIIINNNLKRI